MRNQKITCGEDDYDGFCGRYNGIKLTLQMEAEAANPPAPETGPGTNGTEDGDETTASSPESP